MTKAASQLQVPINFKPYHMMYDLLDYPSLSTNDHQTQKPSQHIARNKYWPGGKKSKYFTTLISSQNKDQELLNFQLK